LMASRHRGTPSVLLPVRGNCSTGAPKTPVSAALMRAAFRPSFWYRATLVLGRRLRDCGLMCPSVQNQAITSTSASAHFGSGGRVAHSAAIGMRSQYESDSVVAHV